MSLRSALLAAPMALLLTGHGAIAQSGGVEPGTPSPTAPAGSPIPGSDQPLVDIDVGNFVNLTASWTQLVADSSRLATTQSTNEAVRALAEQLTEEYLGVRDAVIRAAEMDIEVDYPAAEDTLFQGHQQQLLQLSSRRGEDFDVAYIGLQLQIHRQMDQMFDVYAAGGDDEPLRGIAGETAMLVEKNLAQIEQLSAQLSP
jgi:putative membrane protein